MVGGLLKFWWSEIQDDAQKKVLILFLAEHFDNKKKRNM